VFGDRLNASSLHGDAPTIPHKPINLLGAESLTNERLHLLGQLLRVNHFQIKQLTAPCDIGVKVTENLNPVFQRH
jgi:hypothetical protein